MDASQFNESTSFLSSPYTKRVGHLRGKITTFAYEKIKLEATFAWEYDNCMCDCILRHCFQIPCRHVLPREAVQVPLSFFSAKIIDAKVADDRWKLLCPSVLTDKIDSVYDPVGDGNCGFRSLSQELKGDENLYGDIKAEMLERLVAHEEWYIANGVYLEDDVKKMKVLY
jgi:hypothetical protein